MKRTLLSTVAGASLLAAAFGCAHQQQQVKTPVKNEVAQAPPAAPPPAATDDTSKGDPVADSGGNTVYFDYDAWQVGDQGKAVLERIAAKVKQNRGAHVRIEGNCDERGTEEFNMALGESRAREAKKYLIHLGVPASHIETVSYGKERPAASGHDESAWSKNRRDDLVIK